MAPLRTATARCAAAGFVSTRNAQPIEIGCCRARDDDVHSFRGLGGGSSSGVPQVCIQAFTSAQGKASRVR